MPDLLVTYDPLGRAVTEVEGIRHPVLLAEYAKALDAIGSRAKALLARADLVADGRCALCGRRLSSNRTVYAGLGRDCRRK
jgi:hypothetical protein